MVHIHRVQPGATGGSDPGAPDAPGVLPELGNWFDWFNSLISGFNLIGFVLCVNGYFAPGDHRTNHIGITLDNANQTGKYRI